MCSVSRAHLVGAQSCFLASNTHAYAGLHFVINGDVIDILPGAQKHTNAVAVDMTIAYMILEVATIDSKRRVRVPRNMYSLSLPQILDVIAEQRRQFGKKVKVFNDNTICLAAIEATLTTASNGAAVCKEDALYVATFSLIKQLCCMFLGLYLCVVQGERQCTKTDN